MGNWEPEDEEHDNIRAALSWARSDGDVVLELRFATTAGLFYWPSRGHLTEGLRWLDDVLARSEGADEGLRARALLAASQHLWRQGDNERCEKLAADAQAVFERLDDRAPLAMTLVARSIAAEGRGDPAAEAAHSDRAEALFRELGNTAALDAILSNRGYAEIIAGNFESAERRLRELAETAAGDARLFATANHALALARLGRLDEAETRFTSVLQTAVAERSTEIMFYGFEGLAAVAGSRAEDLRAAQLWGVAAGITEATGYALGTAEQSFHDDLVPEVRARLGDADFDRAWHIGRQRSFEEAMALALRRE
jgi:non-specific serine/threonine protein kinase